MVKKSNKNSCLHQISKHTSLAASYLVFRRNVGEFFFVVLMKNTTLYFHTNDNDALATTVTLSSD